VRPVSEAHEQIRNLLGRYCEAMDAADWAGVGALFAHGALTDGDGNELARGAQAVAAMYAGMVLLHDGSPRTRHLTVNAVVDVHGDTATCRSSFLVLQQLPGGPLQPIAAGRYRDRFTCSSGEWAFAERAFLLDQTGDLSGHLGG
jgi:ketosteroid isomerase-like protein